MLVFKVGTLLKLLGLVYSVGIVIISLCDAVTESIPRMLMYVFG